MQLTNYTDYALRTLIAVALVAPDRITVGEISQAYGISTNHLLKVVQRLAALGYVETSRGKSGGVRLSREPSQITVGEVVRQMEPELGVVGCLRSAGEDCVIAPVCELKALLTTATHRFLAALDEHTLADVMRTKPQLMQLLQLGAPRGAHRMTAVARGTGTATEAREPGVPATRTG